MLDTFDILSKLVYFDKGTVYIAPRYRTYHLPQEFLSRYFRVRVIDKVSSDSHSFSQRCEK